MVHRPRACAWPRSARRARFCTLPPDHAAPTASCQHLGSIAGGFTRYGMLAWLATVRQREQQAHSRGEHLQGTGNTDRPGQTRVRSALGGMAHHRHVRHPPARSRSAVPSRSGGRYPTGLSRSWIVPCAPVPARLPEHRSGRSAGKAAVRREGEPRPVAGPATPGTDSRPACPKPRNIAPTDAVPFFGSAVSSTTSTASSPAPHSPERAVVPGGTADEKMQLVAASKAKPSGNRLHGLRSIGTEQSSQLKRCPLAPRAALHHAQERRRPRSQIAAVAPPGHSACSTESQACTRPPRDRTSAKAELGADATKGAMVLPAMEPMLTLRLARLMGCKGGT